jgi:hypothetical protein
MASYDLYTIFTSSTSPYSVLNDGDYLYTNQSGPAVWTQDFVTGNGKTFTIEQENAGYVQLRGTGNVTIDLYNLQGKKDGSRVLPTDVVPLSSYDAKLSSQTLKLTLINRGFSVNSIQANNVGNVIYLNPDIIETVNGGLGMDQIFAQEGDTCNIQDANGDTVTIKNELPPLGMGRLSLFASSSTTESDLFAIINGVDPSDLLIIAAGDANEPLLDKSGMTKDKALMDPDVTAQSSPFLLLVALNGKGGSGKFELWRFIPDGSQTTSLWGQDKIAEISTATGYNGNLAKQIVSDDYTVYYSTFEDAPLYLDPEKLESAVDIKDISLRLAGPSGSNDNDKLGLESGLYLFNPDPDDDSTAIFEYQVIQNDAVVGTLVVNADILPLHDTVKRYSIEQGKNSFTSYSPSSGVRELSFQGGAYQIRVSTPDGGLNVNADGPNASSFGVNNTFVDGGEQVLFDPLGFANVDTFTLGFNSFNPGETADVTVTAIKTDGSPITLPTRTITASDLDPTSQILNFPQTYTVRLADLVTDLGQDLLGIENVRVQAGSQSSYKISFALSGYSDLDIGTLGADDPITGTADPDTIYGFGENDRILGLEGDDLIRPGTGANTIDGGAGADVIEYFRGQGADADTIDGTPAGDFLVVNGAASVAIIQNQDGDDSTNDWRLTASYVGFLPETFDFLLPTGYKLIPGPTPTGTVSFPTPYSAQIVAA